MSIIDDARYERHTPRTPRIRTTPPSVIIEGLALMLVIAHLLTLKASTYSFPTNAYENPSLQWDYRTSSGHLQSMDLRQYALQGEKQQNSNPRTGPDRGRRWSWDIVQTFRSTKLLESGP